MLSSLPNLDPAVANTAYMELRATIPWLFEDTSPETLARCRSALGTIDSLRPATEVEARFAVQYVAADIAAGWCSRQAWDHTKDFQKAMQCHGRFHALMRMTHRAFDKLLLIQQSRRAKEATAATLASLYGPARPAAPVPAAPQPPAPAAAPSAASSPAPCTEPATKRPDQAAPPVSQPPPAQPLGTPPAQPADAEPTIVRIIPEEVMDKVKGFIRQNRPLALRIRRAGGLTREATNGFRPSALPRDPAVIRALVNGVGPVFDALDGGSRPGGMADGEFRLAA